MRMRRRWIVALAVIGAGVAWGQVRPPGRLVGTTNPAATRPGARPATGPATTRSASARPGAALAAGGPLKQAAELLAAAKQAAAAVPGPARPGATETADRLLHLADVLAAARAGDPAEAVGMTNFQDDDTKYRWAGLLAGAGAFDTAEGVAAKVQERPVNAFAVIAEARLRAGDRAGALRTLKHAAESTPNLDFGPAEGGASVRQHFQDTYGRLLRLLLLDKDFAGAAEVAQALPAPAPRVDGLSAVAEAQLAAGDKPAAVRTLQLALKAADMVGVARAYVADPPPVPAAPPTRPTPSTLAAPSTRPAWPPPERHFAMTPMKLTGADRGVRLARVAGLLAVAGDPSAGPTAAAAIAAAKAIPTAPPRVGQIRALIVVGSVLCTGGDMADGSKAFDEAVAALPPAAGTAGYMGRWEVAIARAEAGDHLGAAKTMGNSPAAANDLDRFAKDGARPATREQAKQFVQAYAAVNLSTFGGPRSAKANMVWALALAGDPAGAKAKANGEPDLLQAYAEALAAARDYAGAKAVAETIPANADQRYEALASIAYAQSQAGDLKGAVATLAGLQSVGATGQRLVVEVARACAEAGQVDVALAIATKAPNGLGRDELVKVLGTKGKPEDVQKVVDQSPLQATVQLQAAQVLCAMYARAGNPDAALKALEPAYQGWQPPRAQLVAAVAGKWAKADPAAAGKWAAGLTDPAERAAGLLAAGRAVLERLDAAVVSAERMPRYLNPNPLLQ